MEKSLRQPSYHLFPATYEKNIKPEISSAKGAFLNSIDGRSYLDTSLGAGSQIFGHADDDINEAVKKQLSNGSIYLRNSSQIHFLCQTLVEVLPNTQNNFVFCNSGTEASQRAIRIARAATGKDHIGYFQGGWHGINEWTLSDDGSRFGNNKKKLQDGIPKLVKDHSIVIPYNVEESFDVLEHNANNLAAIIIEPVQGSNPRDDIVPFLKELQKFCKRHEILLIFDEIITGFRLCIGGASGKWKLEPDIVTYGKILGGGLPVGLVSCTDEIADRTFRAQDKNILTGGTFSANPLVASASVAVIQKLRYVDYNYIDNLGLLLRSNLNAYFESEDLPFSFIGVGSISRLAFTNLPFRNRDERDKLEFKEGFQQIFRQNLLEMDVLWPANGITFTSFCHSYEQINGLCGKIKEAIRKIGSNNELKP